MRHTRDTETFIFPPRVSPNGVVAAVAAAMCADWRVNRFTFFGFPGISLEHIVGGVRVWLHCEHHTAGPLFIEAARAIAISKQFAHEGTYDTTFFKEVQKLVAALESLRPMDCYGHSEARHPHPAGALGLNRSQYPGSDPA